jgi:hypothetical protein
VRGLRDHLGAGAPPPEAFLPPLGYEPYDARLRCLGPSPVTALTSADLRREVCSGLPRLPRLSPSRCVSCTNSCTKPVLDLRVSAPALKGRAWRSSAGTCSTNNCHDLLITYSFQ